MKVFKFGKSVYITSLSMGLFLILLGFFSNITINYIIGSAMFLLAFWQYKNKVVVFHHEYFEVRKSMAGATYFIKYSDIDVIEEKKSGRVILRLKNNPQAKKFKLPLALLSKKDSREFIGILKKLKGKKNAGTTFE